MNITAETSREARPTESEAKRLCDAVLRVLREPRFKLGLTADELARMLGHQPFSIRPRCSDLKRQGLIEATGEKRRNQSGAKACVWQATT